MGNALRLDACRERQTPKQYPPGHRATVLRFPGTTPPVPVAPAMPQPRRRGDTQREDQRRNMLAKVHIALAELTGTLPHFDDDFYRDELEKNYGKRSAADLSLTELDEVLRWFSRLGWQARKGRNRRSAPDELFKDASGMSREELMGKIEAMLAEKGRREGSDVPWGYAVTILKSKSRGEVTSFSKATPKHLAMVIAALYNDARRKGRRLR